LEPDLGNSSEGNVGRRSASHFQTSCFLPEAVFVFLAGRILTQGHEFLNWEGSMMKHLNEKAAKNLTAIREQKPLIHNITNYVVMNYTANALLAMGASPVMAHAQNEVEDMVTYAGALVLNIGTLTDDWILSMIKAGKKASEQQTPIILDPGGSGATPLRTDSAKKIIEQTQVSVIRGNASEILSLRHSESKTKGVDSIHSVEEAAKTATILAQELDTTLAITGPVDLITDGSRVIRVANGHPLMGYVTGTGCTATVTIGAFLAADDDPVSATATALAYFGLAGEVAGQNASAPGSFMIQMIDALYTITPQDLKEGCKIEEN
jgi:hydroxyethylthiazole kinase